MKKLWIKWYPIKWIGSLSRQKLNLTQQGAFINLLSLAAYYSETPGKFRVRSWKYLADILRADPKTVKSSVKILCDLNFVFLQNYDDGSIEISIVNWKKYQSKYLQKRSILLSETAPRGEEKRGEEKRRETSQQIYKSSSTKEGVTTPISDMIEARLEGKETEIPKELPEGPTEFKVGDKVKGAVLDEWFGGRNLVCEVESFSIITPDRVLVRYGPYTCWFRTESIYKIEEENKGGKDEKI